MIYIVCALYIEAKPLIEKYNLKKDNSYTKFQIFSNDSIKVVLSGVGKIKSAIALTYLMSNEKNDKNSYIINIGYVGTTLDNVKLGDIFIPNKIISETNKKNYYLDMLYKHNFLEGTLHTYDEILYENRDSVEYVDMEAYGFYEAAACFFKRDRIFILKIVSDIILENKENRKILDFEDYFSMFEIYKKIYSFLDELIFLAKINENLFSKNELDFIENFEIKLKLSETMSYEFKNLIKYIKLRGIDIFKFFKKYEDIEIKNKIEGKLYFEDIKKRIK